MFPAGRQVPAQAGRRSFVPAMWLTLLGVWTLAVVQPLLGSLARSPEFFVAHRAGPVDILLLWLTLQILLPGLLVGAVYLVRRAGRRAGTIAETGVLALLAASLALQAVKVGVGSWTLAVPLAAAGGVGAALAHRRFPGVRLFASLLAWAALIVVPLLFFGAPGMRSLLAPGLAAGPGTQRPGAAPPKPVPVVLIVFDELPVVSLMDAERRLDRVHYPHLASLADAGVWYRNATTASDFTRWAVPAILSGRYPTPDAIPTPADHPNTLFTLLAPTHRLEVTEAVTDLCPRDLCQADETGAAETLLRMAADLWVVYEHVLATDDLRSRLPELTGNWAGLGEEGRGDTGDLGSPQPAWARRWRQARNRDKVGDARAFVEGISPDDPQPTFYFLHTLLTHHPYTMLPDGRRSLTRVPIPGRAQELWQHDAWAVAQHHQQHLLQAGFADRLVGRLVERLRAAGLYDRALVVITADHGIAFQPGQPLREFREVNAAEIARVPLIVKYPAEVGTSGLVSDRRVETIDIVPTVADVLEVALPWSADGRSLLDTTSPERQSRTLHYDYATRTRTFGPHELDLTDALARQQALFGDASTARSPAPPAFEALVGKRVDELPVADADRRIDIHRPWEYGEMPPERDPVPFEVSGRVPRPLLRDGEAHVAVAVNGVIRAVTRTWYGRGDWMATPPLEAWRPEGNELEVFLVDGREGGARLSRVFRQRPRPPDLNLISGVASLEFGVRQHGFYAHEVAASGPFRWTNGHAVLETRLPDYRRPRSLHVELAMTGRSGRQLTVRANDCLLFDGHVQGAWRADLPLDACELEGETLQLTLAGEAAVPSGRDRRRLGVGVREVRLDW